MDEEEAAQIGILPSESRHPELLCMKLNGRCHPSIVQTMARCRLPLSEAPRFHGRTVHAVPPGCLHSLIGESRLLLCLGFEWTDQKIGHHYGHTPYIASIFTCAVDQAARMGLHHLRGGADTGDHLRDELGRRIWACLSIWEA